ncbi:ExeA family protein [Deferrisoma camini]|uniref:ExeA family protein n=1 Tax=Deferrisoma camini TaxID=1035120 RepID=UPI0004B11938|nr:AAA family ATPase [Deferrisoma camini]
MYEAYWNLRMPPFENRPDPRFFYGSRAHHECLTRLRYAVNRRKGPVLLTGPAGSGKTLVCHRFLASLPRGAYDVAVVPELDPDPETFLREALRRWGQEPGSGGRSELGAQIRSHLLENHRRGVESLLVMDGAHAVQTPEALNEIRLLLPPRFGGRFVLTLVLVGRPELVARVRSVPALDQRIGVPVRLGPLSREETIRYVLTRLKRAGAGRCMFRPRALDTVHQLSEGLPREINTLCDAALLRAYLERAPFVEAHHVALGEEAAAATCA